MNGRSPLRRWLAGGGEGVGDVSGLGVLHEKG